MRGRRCRGTFEAKTHVQTVENIGKWIKWKLSERTFYSTPEKLRNIILNQCYWPLTKNIEKKVWREDLTFSNPSISIGGLVQLVLEAARIILCVCLVLSSLQTRGTSWKSLPFQNLFKDGEEKMFFLFPKGWSWAGHKKGTTFLGSQDRDDPLLENNFLLCSVPKFKFLCFSLSL